jgi:hypothetical protein
VVRAVVDINVGHISNMTSHFISVSNGLVHNPENTRPSLHTPWTPRMMKDYHPKRVIPPRNIANVNAASKPIILQWQLRKLRGQRDARISHNEARELKSDILNTIDDIFASNNQTGYKELVKEAVYYHVKREAGNYIPPAVDINREYIELKQLIAPMRGGKASAHYKKTIKHKRRNLRLTKRRNLRQNK